MVGVADGEVSAELAPLVNALACTLVRGSGARLPRTQIAVLDLGRACHAMAANIAAAPKAAAPAKSPSGAPKLYLICDPKDEAAVEALEDYLFSQGLEVMLPAFDGDDADAAALHQDNLRACDAVESSLRSAVRSPLRSEPRSAVAVSFGRRSPTSALARVWLST